MDPNLRRQWVDTDGRPQRKPDWPAPIDPAEIVEQRTAGWPDFHPETYCHRCGQRNVHSWWTAHDLWAEAVSTGDVPGSHIVCPQCFTEAWEKATGLSVTWELRANPDTLAAARRRAAS